MEQDIWGQMAPRYDTDGRVGMARIITQAIRAGLCGTHDKTAIDFGCGTGLIGFGLIDLFESVLFVDTSAQMIEQVKRKIDSGPVPCARALCCDLLADPPPALRADYVILSQVLLHVPDTRRLLARLYGVINPGGHLLIADFDKNESIPSDRVHNGFVQAELIELAKQVGFASAQAHTFHHGKGIFMNQDASMFLLDARKAAGED